MAVLTSKKLAKIMGATAVICRRRGGAVNVFPLLKTLYLTDRRLLEVCHRPLSGDTYVSLPKGPILSETYNLLQGKHPDKTLQNEWNGHFSKTHHRVTPVAAIDEDGLSELEEKTLEATSDLVAKLTPAQLEKLLHENLPEWEDPQGSSKPIFLKTLLEKGLGFSPAKAATIEKEIIFSFSARERFAH
jgi:hypothetical protein